MLDNKLEKERDKLNKLIEANADYEDILKQSQLLDELIIKKMRQQLICLKF